MASYPFTTTTPVLGVVSLPEAGATFTACDIPGLIAGAHKGRGLGLTFLRHIERTTLLLYVVDMAGTEGRHPWEDFQTLQAELAAYDARVVAKPRVIAANKMDLPEARRHLQEFRRSLSDEIYPISCLTQAGIPALVQGVWRRLSLRTTTHEQRVTHT